MRITGITVGENRKQREFDIRECYSILTSSGQLVTVIPRSDAESSDDSRIFLMLFVLDSASERGMTVTNRLFEIQNHINYLISKKDYSYTELTLSKFHGFPYSQAMHIGISSVTGSNHIHFPFNSKRSSFVLQLTAFYKAKGHLLQRG